MATTTSGRWPGTTSRSKAEVFGVIQVSRRIYELSASYRIQGRLNRLRGAQDMMGDETIDVDPEVRSIFATSVTMPAGSEDHRLRELLQSILSVKLTGEPPRKGVRDLAWAALLFAPTS